MRRVNERSRDAGEREREREREMWRGVQAIDGTMSTQLTACNRRSRDD